MSTSVFERGALFDFSAPVFGCLWVYMMQSKSFRIKRTEHVRMQQEWTDNDELSTSRPILDTCLRFFTGSKRTVSRQAQEVDSEEP